MVRLRARKVYASLIICTCLSISLLVNSTRVQNYEKNTSQVFAAETLLSPRIPKILEYIVITETPIPTRTPTPSPIPTRTPSPKPRPLPPSNLDEIIDRHASRQSVNRDLLKRIAHCESRLNPGATNGIYGGLYQFSEGSWRSARSAMNENPDPNLRFDAEEAIKTAAFKIAKGGTGIWPNCGK